MYKWISSITGWTHVRYINMGTVIGNSYLGWKKPRRKQQYVTINGSTGNIDWYYKFENGTWIRTNADGVDCTMTSSEFTLTLTASNGSIAASVDSPNTYDDETNKVTKMTVADVKITLTATAAEGYEFVKWKRGDVDLTDTKTTITVEEDANVTYTAVFQQEG